MGGSEEYFLHHGVVAYVGELAFSHALHGVFLHTGIYLIVGHETFAVVALLGQIAQRAYLLLAAQVKGDHVVALGGGGEVYALHLFLLCLCALGLGGEIGSHGAQTDGAAHGVEADADLARLNRGKAQQTLVAHGGSLFAHGERSPLLALEVRHAEALYALTQGDILLQHQSVEARIAGQGDGELGLVGAVADAPVGLIVAVGKIGGAPLLATHIGSLDFGFGQQVGLELGADALVEVHDTG